LNDNVGEMREILREGDTVPGDNAELFEVLEILQSATRICLDTWILRIFSTAWKDFLLQVKLRALRSPRRWENKLLAKVSQLSDTSASVLEQVLSREDITSTFTTFSDAKALNVSRPANTCFPSLVHGTWTPDSHSSSSREVIRLLAVLPAGPRSKALQRRRTLTKFSPPFSEMSQRRTGRYASRKDKNDGWLINEPKELASSCS
jgi:hypothetical protein